MLLMMDVPLWPVNGIVSVEALMQQSLVRLYSVNTGNRYVANW